MTHVTSANVISALEHGVIPDAAELQTAALQGAIDAVAIAGGTLVLPAGVYRSGTLRLRSLVVLRLEAGAVLTGSADISDYDARYWGGGFIIAEDLHDFGIEGPGCIDGVDCRNPTGEEGFRGPHCLAFINSRNFTVRDVVVRRSANWAFNCVECSDATFTGLQVEGGHDGVDAMRCERFTFRGCNFRTGDDCIAGPGNRDFLFEDCLFNTACNAFRFSCLGMVVRGCRFVGVAEFPHLITGNRAMLAAFLHFSPEDRVGCQGSSPQSDEWLIDNCTIDGAQQLYEFDHRTLWQSGRPVAQVTFRDVVATGLRKPIWVCGDVRRQFSLRLERVTLAVPPGSWFHHPFVDLRSFDCLDIRGLICQGVDGSHPALSTVDGRRLEIRDLQCK